MQTKANKALNYLNHQLLNLKVFLGMIEINRFRM